MSFALYIFSVQAVRRKTFITFTRRDYHLKRSMFLTVSSFASIIISAFIYIITLSLSLFTFNIQFFCCCFVFVDIRKMFIALTRRNYHISFKFLISDVISNAGHYLLIMSGTTVPTSWLISIVKVYYYSSIMSINIFKKLYLSINKRYC